MNILFVFILTNMLHMISNFYRHVYFLHFLFFIYQYVVLFNFFFLQIHHFIILVSKDIVLTSHYLDLEFIYKKLFHSHNKLAFNLL